MKNLRITVDGKVYQVLVEVLDGVGSPALPPAAAPLAVSIPAAAVVAPPAVAPVAPVAPDVAGPGDVKSPLAGKIVTLDVQAGQIVAEGTQILTIEAMKMNTYIYAPRAGRVEGICVAPGQGVEEGQTLLQIV